MQLTDTHIKTVKPLAKAKKYSDGGGLFLFVPPSGSKFWRMSFRFDKKQKLLSFGEYPTVSLKEDVLLGRYLVAYLVGCFAILCLILSVCSA